MSGRWLLLHGFAGAPALWDPLIRDWSSAPLVPSIRAENSWNETIDRLAALVREQTSAPVRVAGYSLGARLALGLTIRHPELVLRAVLISVHPGLESDAERAVRRQADRRWIELLRRDGIEPFVAQWESQPLFDSQSEAMRAQLRAHRLQSDAHQLARQLEVLGLAEMPSFSEHLAGIMAPVELVVGSLDQKFRLLAEAMALRLPRARVIQIASCGHNPLIENPAALAPWIEE